MKKLNSVVALVLAISVIAPFLTLQILPVMASYPEVVMKQQLYGSSLITSITSNAQSFRVSDGYQYNLTKVAWNLSKVGSPTVNLTSYLYTSSGDLPSGSPLATSNTLTETSLSTSFDWLNFTFSSGYPFINGTWYCIALNVSGTQDGSNYVQWYRNASNPIEGMHSYYSTGSWHTNSGTDLVFILYGLQTPKTTLSYTDNPSGIGSQVTVNGTTYSVPYNLTVDVDNSYSMNATSSLWYSGIYYSFSSWLINGTTTNTTATMTLTISGDTSLEVEYTPSAYEGTDILVKSQTTDGHYAMEIYEGDCLSQSFRIIDGTTYYLTKIAFYLDRFGSPTVNMTAQLYLASGDLPTGSALVSSTPINSSTLSTCSTWYNFTFPSGYPLVNGAWYCMVLNESWEGNLDINNYFDIYTSDNIVEGKSGYKSASSSYVWTLNPTNQDFMYQVYGELGIGVSFEVYPSELPVQVTVNTQTFNVPSTQTLGSGGFYSINATPVVLLSGVYYSFEAFVYNETNIDTNNPLSRTLTGNTSFIIYYQSYIPVFPSGASYCFRSDSHTVNNLTAFQLDTTNTESALDANETSIDSDLTVSWGFRVYILHDGGAVSELTSTYSGLISRVLDGYGYLNSSWSCPSTSLVVGFDSIEVKVYTRIGAGSWTLKGTFTTPRLLEKFLVASTWVFNVYVAKSTGSTVSTFRFGDGATVDSSVTGITFISPNTFDLMLYNLNSGNFFTFIMLPYTALIGSLFYGLVILLLIVPIYIKYHSLDVVLFMLILFGGAGGFFSLLMPISGLQVGFVVMAFAIGSLLYKMITSH